MDTFNRLASRIDPELEALLRLNREPYEFHDDRRVHEALTIDPREYLDELLGGLEAIARGRAKLELPPKAVFVDPGQRSDFRVMPCVVRFPDRVRKTVKIIGTNWPRRVVPGEISVGQAFALHAEENFIEAGFGGCILSSARTGACAATAIRLLAPRRETLAVVGSGRVGYYSAHYAIALSGVRRVLFADLDENRARLAARLLGGTHPDVSTGTFAADDLSSRPDVLVLATDSETPLFDASGHCPSLVVSLGADTDWQRELAPPVLDRFAVYVDTHDSRNYGDLSAFSARGLMDGREVLDMQELIVEPQRRKSPAVLVSTGSALFDNLTIDYLLRLGLRRRDSAVG